MSGISAGMSDLVLGMFIASLNHLTEITALFEKEKAEGRDATLAEVQAVFDAASLSRAKLTIDIATARAAGK